eukprot:7529655-Pyramimonas_sp.AAC.2
MRERNYATSRIAVQVTLAPRERAVSTDGQLFKVRTCQPTERADACVPAPMFAKLFTQVM